MKQTMGKPCKHCPFRSNIRGYLEKERVVEIATSVLQGQSFPCHKTTREIEGDDGESDLEDTSDSVQCAGAEIFAAHNHSCSQMSRISERLGMKVAKLNMRSKVCKTVTQMVEVHCGPQEKGETCEIVGPDCEAPAGFQYGNGVIDGDVFIETTCDECSRFVCDSCSDIVKKRRVCHECKEESA